MDTSISKRYALALFLLAKERKIVQEVERDLAFVNNIFKSHPFFKSILLHPKIEKNKKQGILAKVFCQATKESINFLKLLVEKNRIKNIGEIFEYYKLLWREFYETIETIVSSAFPLSRPEREMLIKVMEQITDKKIEIEERIDRRLIGGIRVEYSGRVYDWTVRTRLERINILLKEDV